jgi:transcriptional regulator with PAS, ATPase and Fis domain
LEALLLYNWPGNVRELRNAVERACVTSTESELAAADLLPAFGAIHSAADSGEGRDLQTVVNTFKTHYIQKVYNESKGNVSEAARQLKVQRSYLSKLLAKLRE